MPTYGVNGIEVCCEDWGPGNGEPVLLIMGLGAQMITWPAGFCSALIGCGLRVIRFDNRDSGLSSKSPGPPPDALAILAAAIDGGPLPAVPYTLSEMAADAVGVLDAVGVDDAHMVGASLGGMIAQTVALEHPARVRSLTSIMSTTGNPAVGTGTPAAFAALTAPAPTSRAEAIDSTVDFTRIVSGPHYDEADARARATESYDRAFHPEGAAFQLAAIAASGDRTEALGDLATPSLVIHGEVDPLIDVSGGRATAAAIDGAELLTFPDMGHDLARPHWATMADAIAALAHRA